MKAVILSGVLAIATLGFGTAAVAGDDYLEYQAQQNAKISYEKAEQLALSAVGGGVVGDIEFEFKRGRSYYEVEVYFQQKEYNVKIDANTGKVLSKKIDY